MKMTTSGIIGIIIVILLLFIIVMGALFFTGKIKSPLSVTINNEIIKQLESPEDTTPDCTLDISPNIITAGDTVFSSLIAEPDTLCIGYGNDGSGWRPIIEGTTNSIGTLSASEEFFVVGSFDFRAICGECTTNIDTLLVNPAPSTDCVDSDGKNKMVAGHVTTDSLLFYDKCVGNSVTEYFCNGGVKSEILPCDSGFTCFETRSGGFCQADAPDLSPGDVIGGGSGTGTLTGSGEGEVIDMSSIISGGDCLLGARIQTSWDYVSQQQCSGIQGTQGVEWIFTDSSGQRWNRFDNVPVSLGVEVCTANYDGVTPWSFEITKDFTFPDCEIDYEWQLDVIVCECGD